MSTLLFRAVGGSTAYGTNNEFSDTDYIEVHIEDPEYVTGLLDWDTKFDTNEGRTEAGGTDTTIYGFQKWAKLAAVGNPNVLETLFFENEATPQFSIFHEPGASGFYNSYWREILSHRHLFVSKSAGRRFLGYSNGQILALQGMRNKKTNRPELVHTHGYDTKFAYHALRTLWQGQDLMRAGEITFPLPYASSLLQVRNGEVSKEDFLDVAATAAEVLEMEIEDSDLPEYADMTKVSKLMHDIYTTAWSIR